MATMPSLALRTGAFSFTGRHRDSRKRARSLPSGASSTGTIQGRISDAQGAVLPGVTVTATSPSMPGVQTAVSSETGNYRFPALPPGTYELTFELAGFNSLKRDGIAISLGFTANGMSVWDVADEAVAEIGAKIGALDEVTHCYERPRHLPLWPYNLFAMVHGRNRAETGACVEEIRALLGRHARASDVLYSARILKKTGMRMA